MVNCGFWGLLMEEKEDLFKRQPSARHRNIAIFEAMVILFLTVCVLYV